MRSVKKIIIFILEIILTMSILVYILTNLITKTILNEKYILTSLQETDYYNKTYEQVNSNFENYIQQSGLEEYVIKNIVTKEKTEKDTKKILHNIYDGLKEEISTEEISKALNKNIEESLGERVLTKEEESSIEMFVQKICEEYKDTILHTKYETTINEKYKTIVKYTNILKKIGMIVIGIVIVVLILINFSRFYRTISQIAIAMISSGGILTISNIYISKKIQVRGITILNINFSEVIRNVLENILDSLIKYGIPLLLSGIMLVIIVNLIHNIRKYGLKDDFYEDS